MQLKQLNSIPEQLLTIDVQSLHTLVPEPTLFHLPGKHQPPLFISVLLHGNETTGFLALQKLLVKYRNQQLPRALSFYLGNTEAAAQGLRRLSSQPDFNRIWPNTELPATAETKVVQEIFDVMAKKQLFASIDVHNNTGLNPHYACVTQLDNRFLQLANLFGRLVVYFTHPKGVQSGAFAEICPSVTLECGKPGQPNGVEHAFEYLNSCLRLSEFSDHSIPTQDIDIYHTVAQVKINENVDFSFDNPNADLLLSKSIEKMNFTEMAKGTSLGTVLNQEKLPVTALNALGEQVANKFFSVKNKQLYLKTKTMPSMLTLDERVIRQDCLCYLMEKIKL